MKNPSATKTVATSLTAPAVRLIVLQLNEINFDLVERYLEHHSLPGFRQLLARFARIETFAEKKYEELEPWIQWVSAHTGLPYAEHKVFRLGDAVNQRTPQVFEMMEQQGLKVGAISPMNTRNELRSPAYFIPDPWTATPSDTSGFAQRLTAMLQQTVNENAQGRVGLQSYVTIGEATLRSFSWLGTLRLLKLILRAKGKQWVKALVLDQLIHLVHMHLLRKKQPDVAFVFMNAGAHIQHHYYFNSPFADTTARNPAWYVPTDADPILEMLQVYDQVLMDHLDISRRTGANIIVATGLTQVPYNRTKFYYRLCDHALFLKTVGITPKQVLPRMTRDFEVLFEDAAAASRAASLLRSMRVVRDGQALFAEVEERGNSLFVTLTYPNEILADDQVSIDGRQTLPLKPHVAFVAIKNGMHSTRGFAFCSPGIRSVMPTAPIHVSKLFGLTLEAAGLKTAAGPETALAATAATAKPELTPAHSES